MAKLSGMNTAYRVVSNKIVSSIQNTVKKLVKSYLNDQLQYGVDSKGDRFPEKKESTKKQYAAKGYDMSHWLIRTGKSTQLNFKNTLTGFIVTPQGANILKNVYRADDWFTLNDDVKEKIMNQIMKDLKK